MTEWSAERKGERKGRPSQRRAEMWKLCVGTWAEAKDCQGAAKVTSSSVILSARFRCFSAPRRSRCSIICARGTTDACLP
eukprot:6212459-Pleurochrysis_carterae.AAC.3